MSKFIIFLHCNFLRYMLWSKLKVEENIGGVTGVDVNETLNNRGHCKIVREWQPKKESMAVDWYKLPKDMLL